MAQFKDPTVPAMNGFLQQWANVHPVKKHPESTWSGEYNCIAWAVDCTDDWIWDEDWYGERGARDAFLDFFKAHGFKPIQKGHVFNPDKSYCVLMAKAHQATHAIRYDPENGWTSKEGEQALCRGNCPQALFKSWCYGQPFAVLVV